MSTHTTEIVHHPTIGYTDLSTDSFKKCLEFGWQGVLYIEYNGGFCPGGFVQGGFCPKGDFVLRGILSRGFCPGGFVWGDFVLEPSYSLVESLPPLYDECEIKVVCQVI